MFINNQPESPVGWRGNLVPVAALFALVNVCGWSSAAENVSSHQAIAIPSHAVLGKRLGDVKAFAAAPKTPVYPKSIHFDLDDGIVYGLIAQYPDKVDFDDLVDAVNRTQRKWWRDSDRQMAKWGVSVWRNEQARVAYQVADSQLIMLWIDRKATIKQIREAAEALATGEGARAAKKAERDASNGGQPKDSETGEAAAPAEPDE
jgi:hypothetical protein